MSKRKISVIFTVLSVITEIIAILLWMIPISGFFIYIGVSFAALIMVIIAWFLSKGSKPLRYIYAALFILYLVGILADFIFIVKMMLESGILFNLF
ncbi:MAG: hypothetical protein PUJ11_07060 [Eubacteriaceae bacterium]|nr:hypothetical protein [Eubacteriaceae bacterium]